MCNLCRLIWYALVGRFRSRASLEAENLVLRHHLNILRRRSPKKQTLSNIDRLIFAGLYHFDSSILGALTSITPETLIRWHRAGFRPYWRWKSKPQGGRPKTELEVRQLIREMSVDLTDFLNQRDRDCCIGRRSCPLFLLLDAHLRAWSNRRSQTLEFNAGSDHGFFPADTYKIYMTSQRV